MPIRVLVVDDLPRARLLVSAIATDLGHEVVGEAENGAEALERIDTMRPDLVVMDWNMPVMNGLDATEAVLRRHPEVRVVAYTSAHDAELERRFLVAGACAHVRKGDLQGLTAALERCG